MTTIHYHREFIKEFKKLPKEIQKKLAILEGLFELSCYHPELHTKKLQGKLSSCYAFRVTRDYRVIFQFTAYSEVIFLAVKHRKDIYQK
ncbi:type II toxin-antitoxin system RelE/ParE family toxin [Candidatus Peregrinibacteria bacterium]|nr:type II toxin-antitoxin system RelE/ParE family toxin [Candidatus Peregrinibacteria bacterium]